jgi:drug/metabolite transporter (DMT)-like permease
MFIGEMGCWLVVFGFWLYQRYLARTSSPSTSHLYQRLPTENSPEAIDDDDDTNDRPTSRPFSSHSHTSSPSPALKPLLSNTTEARPPLTGWSTFLLAIPSSCDIAGTTLMNVGLLFVAASIYQMTRGALVLFVGLFSVLFLHRQLHLYHWFSLFIVVLGVAVVGLAGALSPGRDKNSPPTSAGSKTDMLLLLRFATRDLTSQALAPDVLRTITGILLIAIAQIFTATQFCVEEWILEHYALEPLRVVGWEGIFGFSATLVAQTILHFTVGVSAAGQHGYFDARDGYRQVLGNRLIAVTSVLIMVSIGGFNFFGLSVTRSISATSRSIIDTCRTLFIWIVSLGLGWESFKWLQVVGFALLVYGTFLFNDLVRPPIKALLPRGGDAVRRRRGSLLPEEPIEHM